MAKEEKKEEVKKEGNAKNPAVTNKELIAHQNAITAKFLPKKPEEVIQAIGEMLDEMRGMLAEMKAISSEMKTLFGDDLPPPKS